MNCLPFDTVDGVDIVVDSGVGGGDGDGGEIDRKLDPLNTVTGTGVVRGTKASSDPNFGVGSASIGENGISRKSISDGVSNCGGGDINTGDGRPLQLENMFLIMHDL